MRIILPAVILALLGIILLASTTEHPRETAPDPVIATPPTASSPESTSLFSEEPDSLPPLPEPTTKPAPEPAPVPTRDPANDIAHYYQYGMKEHQFVDVSQLTSAQEKMNVANADYLLLVDENQLLAFKIKGEETEASAPIVDDLLGLHAEYTALMQYAADNHDNVNTPLITNLREEIGAKRKELRKLGISLRTWNSGVTNKTLDALLGER
jgi:hypothetical protein